LRRSEQTYVTRLHVGFYRIGVETWLRPGTVEKTGKVADVNK
jgi:hypothetical protein